MIRVVCASLLAIGLWLVPGRAEACDCAMNRCAKGVKAAPAVTVDAFPAGEKPAEKCKCTGPNDCNCEKGKCGCKQCASPKVGMFFKDTSRIIVARDASAGLRI